MQINLHDGIGEETFQKFETKLKTAPFTKEYAFVSKDQAAEIFTKQTGENFLELTGGINPLLASINIMLTDAYLNADSVISLKEQLEAEIIVSDVRYPMERLTKVAKNIRVVSGVSFIVSLLVIFLAFYLIFNTIKLSIYAQRLTIRSMQLIGATNTFIRKPFLMTGLVQGVLAGVVASSLLIFTIRSIQNTIEQGGSLASFQQGFIGILIGIVLFGAALGAGGSYFAVNRYLNKNIDELM